MKRRKKQHQINPLTGQRIKFHRDALGLSQEELAHRADSTKGSISRVELGKQMPQTDLILNLVREFDVSADYLLGLIDQPHGKVELRDFTEAEKVVLNAFLDNPEAIKAIIEAAGKRQRPSDEDDSI